MSEERDARCSGQRRCWDSTRRWLPRRLQADAQSGPDSRRGVNAASLRAFATHSVCLDACPAVRASAKPSNGRSSVSAGFDHRRPALVGCADAVIGVNPATDSTRAAAKAIPTFCERSTDSCGHRFDAPPANLRAGCTFFTEYAECDLKTNAPVDLVFQSVAGTQKGNESFGITLGLLQEARQKQRSRSSAAPSGKNCMYFETGQASALSSGAHLRVIGSSRPCEAHRLCGGAPIRSIAGQYCGWLHRAGVSCLAESRSFAQALKVTS